jgi:hypothetical protein
MPKRTTPHVNKDAALDVYAHTAGDLGCLAEALSIWVRHHAAAFRADPTNLDVLGELGRVRDGLVATVRLVPGVRPETIAAILAGRTGAIVVKRGR